MATTGAQRSGQSEECCATCQYYTLPQDRGPESTLEWQKTYGTCRRFDTHFFKPTIRYAKALAIPAVGDTATLHPIPSFSCCQWEQR